MASITITEEKSDVPAKGSILCLHLPPSVSQESGQNVQPMTSHELNELEKGDRLNEPENRGNHLVLTKVVPSDKNSRSHETSTPSEGEQSKHEKSEKSTGDIHVQSQQTVATSKYKFTTTKNKNLHLRPSKSSSEFTKDKKETMPHSQSYSGDSGDTQTDLSRQKSILETDSTSTDSIQNKEESQSQTVILFLNPHSSQQSELEQYSKEEGKQSQIQQEQAQHEQNQHEHNQTQEHLLHLQPEQPLNLKQSSYETSQQQMHQYSGQRQQHLLPKQYQQAQQQEQLQSSNEQHPQHQQHEGFVNNDQGSCLNPSLFTCTSLIKESYSKWLQQYWRNTKITSSEDHQHPSEQKELPDLPIVTALSNTAQPFDSLSFSSLSAATASSTVTSAESCTADIQPSSSLKDFRCRQDSTDLSVTCSSSVTDASVTDTSPEVDFVSMTPTSLMPSSASTYSLTSSNVSPTFSTQCPSTQPTTTPMGSCSEDTHQPTHKRRDFVLLFPGDDQEEAQTYADHLKYICAQTFPDLTVDLFSDIDSGQTAFKSSETLHDRYHHILILGNKHLADDHFARFLHENILTTGLRDANGKEDRVIPVWICAESRCLIREFTCIKGFEYFRYLSDQSSSLANSYMRSVLYVVREGRRKN